VPSRSASSRCASLEARRPHPPPAASTNPSPPHPIPHRRPVVHSTGGEGPCAGLGSLPAPSAPAALPTPSQPHPYRHRRPADGRPAGRASASPGIGLAASALRRLPLLAPHNTPSNARGRRTPDRRRGPLRARESSWPHPR
jgi:hypothetical protein